MPSSFEGTFEQNRQEWTVRKHGILTHYFHVGAAMLKDFGNRLAFVDGFAGANQYREEASGSTRIMIQEALEAHRQWGTRVQIHACESDVETFNQMCENLREHIDSGLLRVHNRPHTATITGIQSETEGWPTIVFLDPNRPTQMTIEGDIAPWAGRKQTDILGLCFGRSVHRIVASAKKVVATEKTAADIAGDQWEGIDSEDEAYEFFLTRLKSLSPQGFAGIYRLWKKGRATNRVWHFRHVRTHQWLLVAVRRRGKRSQQAR